MIQAYADESFGDKYAVLAGYLSRQKKWEDFADAWDKALKTKPKIAYFKFKEAVSFSGEFRKFSIEQRTERLNLLIGVIQRFAMASIVTAVSKPGYEEIIKGKFLITELSRRLDNPYCHAFFHFMDFIFDEQETFKNRVLGAYDHFRAAGRDKELAFLGSPPIFRDDKLFMPLQAADMLSGYVNRRSRRLSYPPEFDDLQSIPVVFDLWNRERMESYLEISNAILAKLKESTVRNRQRYMEIRDWIPDEFKNRLRAGLHYPEVGQLSDTD
jgi:hypothetical protein